MSLRTTCIVLTHAILAALHPSLAICRALPLPFPPELRSLICDHLQASATEDIFQSLHESLLSVLSTLCEECKAYNTYVFGPCVMDWPCTRTETTQCHCAATDLPSSRVRITESCDTEVKPWFAVPCRTAGSQLPMYFLVHVRNVLAKYTSMDPQFSRRYAIANGRDLDVMLSRELGLLGCAMVSPTPIRQRGIDDEIILVPCDQSSQEIHTTLARLRLALQLPAYPDPSISLLRTVTCQQPALVNPTTVGGMSARSLIQKTS
ncbi:hypothetical protein ID866_5393 [Astraeus odoratus]|nr:hypothetical protein ID866_5393 [Astraeus odoratus]